MKKRRCILSRVIVVCFTLLAFHSLVESQQSDPPGAQLHLIKKLRACSKHVSRVVTEHSSFPWQLQDMLTEVDHTFLVSYEDCRTPLPETLTRSATCVVGKSIDKCAPRRYLQGGFSHAMKVTFTHAVILQLAIDAGYRHITVLEDDTVFYERNMSIGAVSGFTRLLNSDSWSLIRFGYRPYFLQRNGIEHCATNCRCMLRHFSEHFCEMQGRGCDMRSSDFYVVHSSHFKKLRDMLLDIRRPNSKRIIDVYPMRSFPKQWLVLPQVSSQKTLDIPTEYQLGLGALYMNKCAGPRPLPDRLLVPAHTLSYENG